MKNLIENKTQEVEKLIESYNGAIEITYRAGDEHADELVIEGISYRVEIYIYENEYHLFTSDFLSTYTEDERTDGKNHKTVKTLRGVKGYIKKYALDI